jgi:hypothetical protein
MGGGGCRSFFIKLFININFIIVKSLLILFSVCYFSFLGYFCNYNRLKLLDPKGIACQKQSDRLLALTEQQLIFFRARLLKDEYGV